MLLRVYLLAGLAAHKFLWEYLKRAHPVAAPNTGPLPIRIAKMLFLGGLILQALLPTILPLTTSPLPLQAVGVVVFTMGLLLAMSARLTLGTNWTDIEQGSVGTQHEVVARGLYRVIRHPIYTGDILLILGFELALNSWLLLFVVPLCGYVRRKAVHEESRLAAVLPGYSAYCETTGRFLPRL